MRFTIGTYEISLIVLSAIGVGLYVNELIRISRTQKARWSGQDKPRKPLSRAAGAS
jgi:hypothetical protein